MHWPDSFQANRWLRTINLVLQALLFLSLFAGVNYLALHYSWRFDLTHNRFFSLSAETRSYIAQLKEPVHIVIAFDTQPETEEDTQARRDVISLVREYTFAARSTGQNLITSEELDVFQQTRRAASLGIDAKNVIVFVCGERRHYLSGGDLYIFENREKRAFAGERAFTAALLDVTAPAPQKLYFLTGHGEMEPGNVTADRGLSQLRDELRIRNYEINVLNLARTRAIPDDAALLLIVSPQVPFLPEEQERLRDYLANKAGRLLLALDPGPTCGLDQLLQDWGIRAEDVLVVEPDEKQRTEGGDLILGNAANHPTTQLLVTNQIPLLAGLVRVVRPDPNRPPDPTLKITPLVGTSPTAWGERSWQHASTAQYDRGIDLKGTTASPSLTVAVVSERVTAADLPFNVRGGRFIVLGSADFLVNNRLNGGNLVLTRNAINWASERDTQLNIPPRPVTKFQLTLSQTELGKLRLGLLLIVPGAVALLGLCVYWSRRS